MLLDCTRVVRAGRARVVWLCDLGDGGVGPKLQGTSRMLEDPASIHQTPDPSAGVAVARASTSRRIPSSALHLSQLGIACPAPFPLTLSLSKTSQKKSSSWSRYQRYDFAIRLPRLCNPLAPPPPPSPHSCGPIHVNKPTG